jgi:CheY-like chemotaxis protein
MKTVFFVDDDGLLREMLARSLEKENYRVETFGSPSELLGRLRIECPDLLISDIQMPEMSGLELIETIRRRGHKTPIIIMSGHIKPDVEARACELGVSHVLVKPVKDFSKLVTLIGDTLAETRSHESLDQLRLGFLTELSHELRTPLTAIKIALDGLFERCAQDTVSAKRRLIDISQRNVDRIIRLVESQLDLLQITLGEIPIMRRLANMDEIIGEVLCTSDGGNSQATAVQDVTRDGPVLLFTDPDRVRSVIRCLVDSRSNNGTPPEFSVNVVDSTHEVIIDLTDRCKTGGADGRMDFAGSPSRVERPSKMPVGDVAYDFTYRACQRLVQSLGGYIRLVGDTGSERLQLRLPICPRYEQMADTVLPLGRVRDAASLSEKNVTILRCDIRCNRENNSGLQPMEAEFLQRCLLRVREGDVLVRGQEPGTYYLAVLERTNKQIEAIISFLKDRVIDEAGSGDGPIDVVRVRSLSPGEDCDGGLVPDLKMTS